jgi:hypothetical protein
MGYKFFQILSLTLILVCGLSGALSASKYCENLCNSCWNEMKQSNKNSLCNGNCMGAMDVACFGCDSCVTLYPYYWNAGSGKDHHCTKDPACEKPNKTWAVH